ncbi:bifunctional riboflavin kinase/FAD synthetase [Halobacteriovorax sp. JY17]|uniref:bifunctional riboflavin kinase/FAD synthetase n=1 Tax=Halobacteriovorax sp. JY17 TaxID=2014617 RepID=UPI000C6BB3AA|nr:bifunctional riboflavin kinase/FAD synthetase [Halobacteriovorax sp. JY17]PIK14467.1 MAG: riboflavin biosynthesis protein RibF [Halobacteriovorax sp. JY17]
MKKINSLNEIENEEFAITIGNFDGVHIGHRSILGDIQSKCKKKNQKFVLITFRPHPLRILCPKENFLLNTYSEKEKLISSLNVDYFLEIPFDRDLSTLAPSDFLDKYILINKDIHSIYMGHDFAFGANKEGNFSFVKKYCKDVHVEKLREFTPDEENVSSSIIRKLIDKGDILRANNLLGRNFFLMGTIVKGAGRGKQIGFPTANISYSSDRITPKTGVYITTVEIREMTYFSITNIGVNPTFSEENQKTVETHIFDFDDDIYGEDLKVSFLQRIRDEKKFNSVNELVDQIRLDVEFTKAYFKERSC